MVSPAIITPFNLTTTNLTIHYKLVDKIKIYKTETCSVFYVVGNLGAPRFVSCHCPKMAFFLIDLVLFNSRDYFFFIYNEVTDQTKDPFFLVIHM